MLELAPQVHLLKGFPKYAVNVYLVDDVLIDSGTNFAAKGILKQLAGRTIAAHALTHAHPDHAGSSHKICTALNIPLWCGAEDVRVMASGKPDGVNMPAFIRKREAFMPHPAERTLHEGDAVGSFTVVETPGHCAGHISYWRASDGVLILGDVLFNLNLLTLRTQLRRPYHMLTDNMEQNIASARKIADLKPRLVCFGHGKPRDGAEVVAFIKTL